MKKLNSYLAVITLFLIASMTTTSCIDLELVTITGSINMSGAKFTIFDHSSNSETFSDLIHGGNSSTTTVDQDGEFTVSFRPSGSLSEFTYSYGNLRSSSAEIPIDIELGEVIDLGLLEVEMPVLVQFAIPNTMFVDGSRVDFTTFSENGFEANTDGSSEMGKVLIGYLYENQINTVEVSQRNSTGDRITELYEIVTDEVTPDELIVLE